MENEPGMSVTVADFLTAFTGKSVDIYCGGKDWFYGTVKEIVDGVVTLVASEGTIHINTDRILSVSPRTA
jgi:hypothetical protein